MKLNAELLGDDGFLDEEYGEEELDNPDDKDHKTTNKKDWDLTDRRSFGIDNNINVN